MRSVDTRHEIVRGRRQDRAGTFLLSSTSAPGSQNSGHRHDWGVLQEYFEWSLRAALLLPFEESTEGNDAPGGAV